MAGCSIWRLRKGGSLLGDRNLGWWESGGTFIETLFQDERFGGGLHSQSRALRSFPFPHSVHMYNLTHATKIHSPLSFFIVSLQFYVYSLHTPRRTRFLPFHPMDFISRIPLRIIFYTHLHENHGISYFFHSSIPSKELQVAFTVSRFISSRPEFYLQSIIFLSYMFNLVFNLTNLYTIIDLSLVSRN